MTWDEERREQCRGKSLVEIEQIYQECFKYNSMKAADGELEKNVSVQETQEMTNLIIKIF